MMNIAIHCPTDRPPARPSDINKKTNKFKCIRFSDISGCILPDDAKNIRKLHCSFSVYRAKTFQTKASNVYDRLRRRNALGYQKALAQY